MSESDDIDTAVQRVRDAFDEAVDEAEELSDQARESVEDAIEPGSDVLVVPKAPKTLLV